MIGVSALVWSSMVIVAVVGFVRAQAMVREASGCLG